MVVVRMVAEFAVGISLVAAFIFLWATHRLESYTTHMQMLMAAAALAGVGLVLIPAHGFIVYQVNVELDGLRLIALLRRRFVAWQAVQTVSSRAVWGVRRFVVTTDQGVMTIPYLIKNAGELIEEIRRRLPNRGRTTGGGIRVYGQDLATLLFQLVQLGLNIVFAGLFWIFLYGLWRQTQSGQVPPLGVIDLVLVGGFCLLLTLVLLIRIACLAMAPSRVTLDGNALELSGLFLRRKLDISEIQGVLAPFFFLPDGLILKTSKEWLFIGENLDAVDELQDELWQRAGRLQAPGKPKG